MQVCNQSAQRSSIEQMSSFVHSCIIMCIVTVTSLFLWHHISEALWLFLVCVVCIQFVCSHVLNLIIDPLLTVVKCLSLFLVWYPAQLKICFYGDTYWFGYPRLFGFHTRCMPEAPNLPKDIDLHCQRSSLALLWSAFSCSVEIGDILLAGCSTLTSCLVYPHPVHFLSCSSTLSLFSPLSQSPPQPMTFRHCCEPLVNLRKED